MQTNKRNGEIDVLRFLFCMVIVNLHFKTGIFPYGAIGVEFFFVLSGLLMARHAERETAELDSLSAGDGANGRLARVADKTWEFMKGKIGAFYKYYIVAFAFNIIVRNVLITQRAAASIIYGLLKSIPTLSVTFMTLFGRQTSYYVHATWYLSAMLVAMFILYPILLKNYRYAVKIIFPIVTIFLLGYQYTVNQNNSLIVIDTWTGFVYTGILRAVSEIAFGACIYYIATECRQKSVLIGVKKPLIKALTTLIKMCCFAIVLLYAHRTVFGMKFDRSFSLHALFFIGIGLLLSYCGAGYTIPDSKLTRYLGRISLPIYIFHKLLRQTWLNYLGVEKVSAKYAMLMAAVCVIASVALMYVTDALAKWLKKPIAALKKYAAG